MRQLKIIGLAVVMLVIFSMPVWGAGDGTINVTVTPKVISLSVTPGSYNYGPIQFGGTAETTTTFAVTNDGNVSENFLVRGVDTTNWALAGTAGVDAYRHQFKEGAGSYANLTTGNQSAASGVAAGGSRNYRFQLSMPTSGNSSAQNPNLTFTATE